METEIWFNFVREAGKSGAKVVIVNGRLSEKSANRYMLIQKTMRRVLHYVDLILMQSQKDARRMLGLGARGTKISVTGNIKFDQPFEETESDLTREFRERFAVSKDAPLIVVASTHAPEESLILEAFKLLNKSAALGKQPRLMIAPRHPERFAEVANLIEATGFDWAKRSETSLPSDKTAKIILLDSIGELRAIYPLSEIVFVGGSLIPHGGQNVLEPAAAQKAIVSGFYTMNFEAIIKEFTEQNALIQLPKLAQKEIPAKLAEVFTKLLDNDEQREKLASNAFHVMRTNRGATHKTIEQIKLLLMPK
jgi:3-deoxy-D-manno-octulosonic-acid transferase